MTHYGFALDLSDIYLWNIDLLDTHLDLLDTDITSKKFICLRDVWKTSSRHIFKMSSRHVFKTSSRRLQRNNFSSSKTSWRRLQDVLEDVKLLRRRPVEDIFKTCLADQQMFAGMLLLLLPVEHLSACVNVEQTFS